MNNLPAYYSLWTPDKQKTNLMVMLFDEEAISHI